MRLKICRGIGKFWGKSFGRWIVFGNKCTYWVRSVGKTLHRQRRDSIGRSVYVSVGRIVLHHSVPDPSVSEEGRLLRFPSFPKKKINKKRNFRAPFLHIGIVLIPGETTDFSQ